MEEKKNISAAPCRISTHFQTDNSFTSKVDCSQDGINLGKGEINQCKKSSFNSFANTPQFCLRGKKNGKIAVRASSSKSPNKPKHPIIRSFIIKQPKEENLSDMMFDCNAQHKNFICLLDQCLNKRSLNVSNKIGESWKNNCQAGSQYDENKNLSESFNNLKVKQCLKSVSISGLNFGASPKAKLTQKYNREMIRKSIKLSKNYSVISNETDTKQGYERTQKQSFQPNYTNVTEYNSYEKISNFQDQSSVNNHRDCKKTITTSNFNDNKNQISYLWNFKQKKCKQASIERARGSSQAKPKFLTNFSNSQLLGYTSINKQKYVSKKKIPARGCGLREKQKKIVFNACASPSKIEENTNTKIGELQIFTHIPTHTPTKRKISTQVFSLHDSLERERKIGHRLIQCEAYHLEKVESSTQNMASLNKDDLDEGNSCYLRTVNF